MKRIKLALDSHVIRNVFLLSWNLVFLWIVFSQIALLRPIADDYCAASVSDKGPFVAVVDYFQNWWGDATSLFFYSLFVGVPLRLFGDAVGSLIPFLILNGLIFALGSLFYAYLNSSLISKSRLFLSGTFFLTSWLTFWQSWSLTGEKSPFEFQTNLRLLSAAMIHWKTVQITYVFTSILLVLFFVLNFAYSRGKIRVFFYGIIGLAIGMSSYIFAISFGLTILAYFVRNRRESSFTLKDLFTFGACCLSGFLISFLSPGSTSRRLGLANYPIPELSLQDSFSHWIRTMASFLISGSFISALLFGALFYMLFLSRSNSTQRLFRIFELIPYIGAFLIISSIITTVANYHIGWSAWHSFYWAETIWFFGFFLGMKLISRKYAFLMSSRTSILLFGICVLVSLNAASTVSTSIFERWTTWEKGPAPIAGIEDREVEWVQTCINSRIYSD